MNLIVKTIFNQQFIYSNGSVILNTSDITHEESLISPEKEANCLNWIVGHIIDARNQLLELLDQEPVWDNKLHSFYIRGSQPLQDDNLFLSFYSLLALLKESNDRILKGLNDLRRERHDEIFSIRAPDGTVIQHTLIEWLTTFSFHESYHAGQTGVLRKMLGKEGKIK